jgi:hypothetical protein
MFTHNPRHTKIAATQRGVAKTIADLGGVWSPNLEYGKNLVVRANQIQEFATRKA